MQSILNFIKYHNLFTIILGLVLLLTGSIFASEDVRDAVVGEKIETQGGIDNFQILTADLDNFDLALKIINVAEDSQNYYLDYAYQTFVIQDNIWQKALKEKKLTVSKNDLEGKDLGLYIQEELSEVADYELSYLKEVQTMEREKGQTKFIASVEYTGLIGLVLDVKSKLFPAYEPVVQSLEPEPEMVTAPGPSAPTESSSASSMVPTQESETSQLICQNGASRPCSTEVGACQIGIEVCQQGVWGECIGAVMPSEEMCDGVDNDCDGQTDEDNACLGGFYAVPSSPQ